MVVLFAEAYNRYSYFDEKMLSLRKWKNIYLNQLSLVIYIVNNIKNLVRWALTAYRFYKHNMS